jgi:hypothetical protein
MGNKVKRITRKLTISTIQDSNQYAKTDDAQSVVMRLAHSVIARKMLKSLCKTRGRQIVPVPVSSHQFDWKMLKK